VPDSWLNREKEEEELSSPALTGAAHFHHLPNQLPCLILNKLLLLLLLLRHIHMVSSLYPATKSPFVLGQNLFPHGIEDRAGLERSSDFNQISATDTGGKEDEGIWNL
jgi:hypothetical protein